MLLAAIGLVFVAFSVAVICLFAFSRSRSNDSSPFGLVADPEKLERAEREVKNYRAGDLVVAAVFRSDQGHNEASLASLLIYLGSEDVEATYDTTAVGFGGGALIQFTLKVPPAHLEKARMLLRVKLASG